MKIGWDLQKKERKIFSRRILIITKKRKTIFIRKRGNFNEKRDFK